MSLPLRSSDVDAQLQTLFNKLAALFRQLDRTDNDKSWETCLGEIVQRINESKALSKQYEKLRKAEGADADLTKARKAELIATLNDFLAKKKTAKEARGKRGALFASSTSAAAADSAQNEQQQDEGGASTSAAAQGTDYNAMSTQELMTHGRETIKASDESLARSVKVVNETLELGKDTAAKLKEQTGQMERVVDELDEIQFNLKKAGNVIRDMTRSAATDKCIQVFLLIIAIGVVVIIALKATGRDKGAVRLPGEKSDDSTTLAPQRVVRRMLREVATLAAL